MWHGELGRKAYQGECICACKDKTFISLINTKASEMEKSHTIWRKYQKEASLLSKVK